jgi:iron complex outermembrane receptor protein
MQKIYRLLTVFLLLAASIPVAAQRISVTGRVTDTADQPIVGAFVAEKGTSNGTVTGIDGVFTIRVDIAATLQVSFLGYVTREVSATEVEGFPIIMNEDATQIGEVVVIGYGTVRKDDLTGSVATVKVSELNRGAVTSTQGLLQGKAPGLHILPGDGGPGSGSTIRIRGGSSLSASNDPLIVIDGLPVWNDGVPGVSNLLATLNPNDIESFSILKDASSTAIYGSRASNGVIMITTKKGAGTATGAGLPVQISYNSSYSVSVNSKLVEVMSPSEYREYITALYPEGTTEGTAVRNLMGTANTEWQKEIFRPALSTDQNLSLFGNVKNSMPYRLSLGYTDESGTLKTSNFKRGTIDLSLSPSFFKNHLKVTVNVKESYTKNRFADGGAVGAAAFFDPTQEVNVRNAEGAVDKSVFNGWWNWGTPESPNSLAIVNPMSMLHDQFNRSGVNRLTGNVQLDYKLHWLPELRFNLNLGLDRMGSNRESGERPGSVQAAKSSDAKYIGMTNHEKEKRVNRLLDFYAAYEKELGRHRFDAMAGYSWQHFLKSNDNYRTFNDDENTLDEDFPLWEADLQLLSFFGRVNYSFDSRFLLTFSMRADGSSRFAKDKRWGYFPSAALAWNIKNEAFLEDSGVVSDLKLRLGYGETGQQDIGGFYPYLARYNLSVNPESTYIIDGQYRSILKPDPYDPNITWETTATYNVGVDYGFMRGTIYGSLDFYLRKTRDLLYNVEVPRGSNFSNKMDTNVGNMENKGVELALGANIINRRDLTWTVGTNVTWQSTRITKLILADNPEYFEPLGGIGGTGSYSQIFKVGYAPYTFQLFQQVWGADGKPVQNVFVDRNGDGMISEADRYNTGKKRAPDVFFGLNMQLTWRKWDFGFNSHGSFGNWVFNRVYSDNATPVGDYLTQGFLKNIATTVKRSGFIRKNEQGQLASDMFLENGSFFRMDDITLGYTFENIFPRLDGSRLRLAFTAQNPFIITGYSGLDPEVGDGIDNTIWPRPRIFSVRASLNF